MAPNLKPEPACKTQINRGTLRGAGNRERKSYSPGAAVQVAELVADDAASAGASRLGGLCDRGFLLGFGECT